MKLTPILLVILALGLIAALAWWLWWPRFSGLAGAGAVARADGRPFFKPSPEPWARFLRRVVDARGLVDYERAVEARADLDDYLDQVARATPAQFARDEQRLAFYINAYNALVIEGVLFYWPIASVEDVGPLHRFFRERRYRVAGVRVSLHGLEAKVIRQFDPRMHFALNCASASCPRLNVEPFRAESLDRQLEAAAAAFINDPRHNRYDAGEKSWQLSKIFQWYADDFGGESGVRELLRRHAATPWPEDAKLSYLEYDWSLNAAEGVPSR